MNSSETLPELSHMRRELMHAAMDGHFELAGAMHCLHQYKHCDTILRWLVFNRITGENLVDLLKNDLHANVRELVEFVVRESHGRLNEGRTH